MVLFGSGFRVAAIRAVNFDIMIGPLEEIGDGGLLGASRVDVALSPLVDGTVARRITEGERPCNLATSNAMNDVPSATSRACSTGESRGDAADPISVGLSA